MHLGSISVAVLKCSLVSLEKHPRYLNVVIKFELASQLIFKSVTLEIALSNRKLSVRSGKRKLSVSRLDLKMGISDMVSDLMSSIASDGRCSNESGVAA